MNVRLNREWSLLLERYKGDHKDPRNRATHMVGIPMILASLPISATVIGLPLGAALFTSGWALQFLGHYYEGNDPAFFTDKRSLAVGAMWWAEKAGILSLESAETPAPAPRVENVATA
jgi:uncharacterized membrane protein YGL010W